MSQQYYCVLFKAYFYLNDLTSMFSPFTPWVLLMFPEGIQREHWPYPFNDQCSHNIETSPLIFRTNQLTDFYMLGTLVVKVLNRLIITKTYSINSEPITKRCFSRKTSRTDSCFFFTYMQVVVLNFTKNGLARGAFQGNL